MEKSIISKAGILSLFFLSLFFVANVGEVSATTSEKVSPCDSYGDVNLDGYITTEDSSLVASNITGEVFFGTYETILADVNNDGSVNIGDLAAIDSFIAGNITTFPVCSQRSVYLYSPNGGEKFFNGDVMDIKWTASGVEQIKIYLIKGDSIENLPGISIATSVNSVSFKWTIPQSIEAGNDYKIKIIDAFTEYTVNSESNHDLSDNYFSIIAISQGCADLNSDGKVDYTDLGVVGSAFDTCSGDTNYNYKADINGDNCVDQKDLDIVSNRYNTTTTCAQANVCPDINTDSKVDYVDLGLVGQSFFKCSGQDGYNSKADLNGDNCVDNGDALIIDKYYNVLASNIAQCTVIKSITVTSPNGGEQWIRGNKYDITWNALNVNKVNIEAASGGHGLGIIASGVDANIGKYSWIIPENFGLGFNDSLVSSVKIRINDSVDASIYDVSDNDFTVRSGELLPDLIVESVKIDAYHNTIAKIKNIGTALYSASYNNPFISWKDLTSGKTGSIKNYRIVNIPAGGSEEFIITKDIVVEGEHDLEITVDPDNVVTESNENNNSSDLSIVISENKLPDLVITGIEVKKVIDPHLGEGVDIVARVKNIGEGYYVCGDSRVEKFISWSDSISGKSGSIGNYKLISILPGETKEYSIYRTGLDLESYNIRVTVDPENIIEESNDQNNIFIKNSARNSCLIDGTLVKLPNDPKIYVIINCKRYWVKTAKEFQRRGYKWENIKITTDDELNSLAEDSTIPSIIKEGAIIRAVGDIDIYIVKYIGNKKFKRLILNPSVFRSYGHLRWEDVIEVEEETVDSFATSNLVRNARTGRIYRLTANGDNGIRRHFRSISVMQRLGHDLDAVYEINETDENSYEQGDDLE